MIVGVHSKYVYIYFTYALPYATLRCYSIGGVHSKYVHIYSTYVLLYTTLISADLVLWLFFCIDNHSQLALYIYINSSSEYVHIYSTRC